MERWGNVILPQHLCNNNGQFRRDKILPVVMCVLLPDIMLCANTFNQYLYRPINSLVQLDVLNKFRLYYDGIRHVLVYH